LIAYTSFMWWASAGESQSTGLTQDDDQVGEDELDRALLLSEDEGRGEEGAGGGEQEEEYEEDEAGEQGSLLTQETAIVGFFRRLTGVVFATLSDAISRVDGEGVRRGGGKGRGLREYADGVVDVDSGGGGDGVVGLGLAGDGVQNVNQGDDERVEEGDGQEEDDDNDGDDDDDDDDENKPLLPSLPTTLPPPGRKLQQAAEQEQEQDQDQESPTLPAVEITPEDMTQMGLDVWSAADRAFVEELVPLWWGRDAVVRGGRIECCGVRVL
jgi:Domain of unknown function (DUF4484)